MISPAILLSLSSKAGDSHDVVIYTMTLAVIMGEALIMHPPRGLHPSHSRFLRSNTNRSSTAFLTASTLDCLPNSKAARASDVSGFAFLNALVQAVCMRSSLASSASCNTYWMG
jgi:hypothetical protein